MTDDPFKEYASKMQDVKASDLLLDSVLKRADEERKATGSHASFVVAGEHVARKPHPRPRRTSAPAWKFAVAACLALLAIVVGTSLSLPKPGGALAPSLTIDSPFVIKAYGSVDATLLPSNSNGTLLFNYENETQRYLPPDRYDDEGFYTGCVFSVEGENIARVQAHVSKGELYRVTSKVYSRESDPEFFEERNGWKTTKIGQGELLGKYDYVAGVLFYGALDEDGENADKDRNDPSHTAKVNLYQRLGSTIDTDAMDAPESDMENYAFGLWTNEPFDAEHPDPNSDFDSEKNHDAALDTLDGAQLTVTVTFTDGTCATQVVDLHAADFKANVFTVANGMNKLLELVPEIIEAPDYKTGSERYADLDRGIASIHTLYGLVNETNDEPFPHGDASCPFLTTPLTEPLVFEPAPVSESPGSDEMASMMPPGPMIQSGDIVEIGASYEKDGITTTFDSIEVLDGLPDGLGIADLCKYYDGSGGSYDPDADSIETQRGYTIASDGSLSPEFSYVLLTKTFTNASDEESDVYLTGGFFATIEEKNGAYQSTYAFIDDPVWRSDHEGPAWDSHIFFQMMAPGETRTISILYILPDEVLENPNLGLVFEGPGGSTDGKALRIGALK